MVEGAGPAAPAMPGERRVRGRHAARRKRGKGGAARSSVLMAVGTVVSRATGLIRQVLQAARLRWAAARARAGLGSGTGPTVVALTAGVLTTALGYPLPARLTKPDEPRRLPGTR